ncbi:MAG: glycosyltransferase family 2 protein [Sphingobacteriaceae bacterium]|nr:MAG: glycosyltransferase family 2 protein [Sphingobacteriaceae bacterium]
MISQDFLPKVSCLIINEGKYGLCKTLQSVAIQTYPNLECIIVNSSSTNENISSFNNIIHESINVNSTDENFLIEKAVNESSGEFIFFIKNNNYFFDENINQQY